MSELESVAKLRKYTLCDKGERLTAYINADELADEIEREHNQRVAELNGAVCERDGRIGAYERRNTELNDALKAICKRFGVSTEWSAEDAAKKVLEALERDYMELPVDADGVPIHAGDICEMNSERFEVRQLTTDGDYWRAVDRHGSVYMAKFCRHVEPCTIEDVLRDVVTLCANTWKDEKSAFRYYDVDNMMESGNIADFADEIRELMGGEK